MKNYLGNYKLEGEQLPILTFPHPVLTQKAKPVTDFSDELKILCKNMLYTMYKAPGIGLAAPQIGKPIRLFVLDVDYNRDPIDEDDDDTEYNLSNFTPHIFINPTIEIVGNETMVTQEGCLSLPDLFEDVTRHCLIKVKFQDLDGNHQEIDATDLLSICIQHENDHLDGKVFIDRLSQLKRLFYKKKFLKKR